MKKFLLSFALFIIITGYASSTELTLYEFFYKHTVLKGQTLSQFINMLYDSAKENDNYYHLNKFQIDNCNRIMIEKRKEKLFK
jgi:hypothetical protein